MSKTLTFDADPKHLLEVDGHTVVGGEQFTVTDARALQLLADQSIPLKEETQELSKLTRQKLDDLARDRGLNPDEYGSKTELIEAIEAPIPDHTVPEGD